MKSLSNPGSVWPTRLIMMFLLIITGLMLQDVILEKNWLASILPFIFLSLIYCSTKFNSVKCNNGFFFIKNFLRIKTYRLKDFKEIKQGIFLPNYYIIIFTNGDKYHFRRGYGQVRLPSFKDRSLEAKKIQDEILLGLNSY